jgi:hypothetical protein
MCFVDEIVRFTDAVVGTRADWNTTWKMEGEDRATKSPSREKDQERCARTSPQERVRERKEVARIDTGAPSKRARLSFCSGVEHRHTASDLSVSWITL